MITRTMLCFILFFFSTSFQDMSSMTFSYESQTFSYDSHSIKNSEGRFKNEDKVLERLEMYDKKRSLLVALVCDGHGGDQVSTFLCENLYKKWCFFYDKNHSFEKSFLRSFEECEKEILKKYPDVGSTAVLCIFDLKTNKLHVAHVGDSRAIALIESDGSDYDYDDYNVTQLTEDHKPVLGSDEGERILKSGGRLLNRIVYEKQEEYFVNNRVHTLLSNGKCKIEDCDKKFFLLDESRKKWLKDAKQVYCSWQVLSVSHVVKKSQRDQLIRMIAMSRSFGDKFFKKFGLSAIPEINEYQFDSSVKFIVIATDGLWDVLANEDVTDFVSIYGSCEELCNDAREKGSEDDISVAILSLNESHIDIDEAFKDLSLNSKKKNLKTISSCNL